nr:MAG TPA: hypothetical protein [Caudoviricetes sp.]
MNNSTKDKIGQSEKIPKTKNELRQPQFWI